MKKSDYALLMTAIFLAPQVHPIVAMVMAGLWLIKHLIALHDERP